MSRNLLKLLAIGATALMWLFHTSIIIWPRTDFYGNLENGTNVTSGTIAYLLIFGIIATAVGAVGIGFIVDASQKSFYQVMPELAVICLAPGGIALTLGFMTLGWSNMGVYKSLQNASQIGVILSAVALVGYLLLRHLCLGRYGENFVNRARMRIRPSSNRTNLHRCSRLRQRFVTIVASPELQYTSQPSLAEFIRQVKSLESLLSSLQTIMQEGLAGDGFRMDEALKLMDVAAENSERYLRLLKLNSLPSERQDIPDSILPAVRNRVQAKVDRLLDKERISIEVSREMLEAA